LAADGVHAEVSGLPGSILASWSAMRAVRLTGSGADYHARPEDEHSGESTRRPRGGGPGERASCTLGCSHLAFPASRRTELL
jgi:hypothetical protein